MKKALDRFYSEDFKITRKAKWYAIAPMTIILIGVMVISIWNFNLGLDFTGGHILVVRGFADYDAAQTQVTQILSDVNGMNMNTVSITREETATETRMSIRFQDVSGVTSAEMNDIRLQLVGTINSASGALANASVYRNTTISGAASRSLIMNTIYAVLIALFGILVYMLFRFRMTSGISTVLGLVHDVLVMMALTAIFRVQINAPFIAGLITVVAYSINNTLILFDRVRQHEKHNDARLTTEQIVDKSVKETFARTMATTITTLVPIMALIILGGIFNVPLITQFAIPILFGLIAGTFSTIFVTTSLYVRFESYQVRKRRATGKSPVTTRQKAPQVDQV